MKLLYFTSDFKIGVSVLLTEQLLHLYNASVELQAISGIVEQQAGLVEKIINNHVPLKQIEGFDEHKNYWHLVSCIRDIILNDEDIFVVHVQNNWQLALMTGVKFTLSAKRNLKVIYTLHAFRHNHPVKSVVARIIIGIALFLFADKVICMCSYLVDKFKFLRNKIVRLPLGVDDKFMSLEIPNLPSEGLRIIFPAQFRKGKNQDVIIRAFAKHIKNTEDEVSELVLPGDGDMLDEMKRLAEQMGIKDRVVFPGNCTKERTFELYLESNIGVVSSNSETFGQSIVEPFVLGRCVLSTPVGVALDIIKDSENGFIFHNESELAECFTKLYQNPSMISEMGYKNFSQRDMFSWQNISEKYKEILL